MTGLASIFWFALKFMLEDGERAEADDGHIGKDPIAVNVAGGMVHPQDDILLCI